MHKLILLLVFILSLSISCTPLHKEAQVVKENLALNPAGLQTIADLKAWELPKSIPELEFQSFFRVNADSFLSLSKNGLVLLWKRQGLEYKAFLLRELGPEALGFTAASFKEPYLALASKSKILVYNLLKPESIYKSSRIRARVMGLDFAQDSLLIAAADAHTYQWYFNSALKTEANLPDFLIDKDLHRYVGHQNIVSAVKADSNSQTFFSADWSGQVYLWLMYAGNSKVLNSPFKSDIFTSETVKIKLNRGSAGVEKLALIDAQHLLIITQVGAAEVWYFNQAGQFSSICKEKLLDATVLSFDLKDKQLALISRNGNLGAWNIEFSPAQNNADKTEAQLCKFVKLGQYKLERASPILFSDTNKLIVSTEIGQISKINLKK